ncbi:MAG: hypothetical protein JKY65_06315 [Planctomycetes bacterium]|nr:hypothetical protein [Planctomycetota bacterium]
MNELSRDLLRIALDRGYLEPDVVKLVAREARERDVMPERVLLERRILSVRRLERLRSHLRYTVMRRNDQRYATIACKSGVSKPALKAALKYQKTLFQSERRCVRVGSRLVEQGWVSLEIDRRIRAKAKIHEARKQQASRSNDFAGTHTLPLDDESALRSNPSADANPPSYAAIEAALARVEAIRALQDDLSTSEPCLAQDVGPDSAMELENACQMLARRRAKSAKFSSEVVPSASAAAKRKRKKRSSLARILGAA